ncbi:hypothetical protein UFOVP143_29 [uncultured Caudovirales phage]|uniref:Uncharacterized protein n=1 Tax=uncultured Caudovirales phage TaxID=2100421 RepID=A0A6J7VQE0_9CAUD|nr:hypothetical protein UFOVP143_29 [uncultured Caudovirales phage]
MNLHPRHQATLELPIGQFEALHQALAKVRSTSSSVTVDKQALTNLLMDYSRLINVLEKKGAA